MRVACLADGTAWALVDPTHLQNLQVYSTSSYVSQKVCRIYECLVCANPPQINLQCEVVCRPPNPQSTEVSSVNITTFQQVSPILS